MKEQAIKASELILNEDGSVYHIRLKPEHIADTVLLVGDQGRVKQISKHFDKIEYEIENREFITHTGYYKGMRLTALSTGIGADNIDIVLNELDAAVNIDLETRMPKTERRVLNLIRIGTSGALQPDVEVGSQVIATHGLGLEGLIYYYDYGFNEREQLINEALWSQIAWPEELAQPYLIEGSIPLIEQLGKNSMHRGITATASGFYAPQGRQLSLAPRIKNMHEQLVGFEYEDQRVTNFEMETAALYGLGKLLGHRCCTCCAIIANRFTKNYEQDYKPIVDRLILTVLDRLVEG